MLAHRKVVIPIFAWVLWFHLFWVLGYCWGFQHIEFFFHRLLQSVCVVGLLDFLFSHVGTLVIIFKCGQEFWYQLFHIYSSSSVKFHRINFRVSLQLLPHSYLWAHSLGILNLPCLCNQFQDFQQRLKCLLGNFCGSIVLGCIKKKKNIFC